jgi:SAM-dependent methyltransferase
VRSDEYARIADAEDAHWWYRATRQLMTDMLEPWLGGGGPFLDAGCGPGGNGAWLSAHGPVVGADLSSDALRFVADRRPGTRPVRATVESLPFGDCAFAAAVAVTVLYAVADDSAAVAELARAVRPGGAVLLFEPAFSILRRAHDDVVHTRRRYRRAGLATLAAAAGLRVRRSTYAYSFLVPAAAALAAAERVRPPRQAESDVDRQSLSRPFAAAARLERRVLRRRDVPVGLSAVVLAEKP